MSGVREVAGSGATLALQGYLTLEAGRLVAHAVLEDCSSGRSLKGVSASVEPAKGPLPLADALAHAIDERARPFGTANTAALRAYLEALSQDQPDAARAAYQRAVADDPNFGEAYVAWAQWSLARGDRAEAERVFAAARERFGQINDLPRAELAVLSELTDGPYQTRRHSLLALSRLTPADATVFGRLGALDLAARQFQPAVDSYKQALEREPANPVLLNELGYAQAYASDLSGAVQSLEKYRTLQPANANPLDSLGDVHYLAGRFRDAERFYLEAQAKDPAFGAATGDLAKAAQARLMSGDAPGAAEIFGRYLDGRRARRDPLIEYRQAQWEILSGRRAQAAERLERFAAAQPPAAWLAMAQLSVLSLDSGDRGRARQYAVRALDAPGGAQQALAAVCVFLAQPSAPASGWVARAEKELTGAARAGRRNTALAFALLFDGHFGEAIPLLEEIYRQTPPSSPDPVGIYLGWALVESGRAKEARAPLAFFPLPNPNTDQPLSVVALPRLAGLRARAGL